MAHRNVGIRIHLAPAVDDKEVEINGSPAEFRRAHPGGRGLKIFAKDLPAEHLPKKQPKYGELKTGFHYLMTYLNTNTLHPDTRNKASKSVPDTKSWNDAREKYDKVEHSINDSFGSGTLCLYYLGEDEVKIEEGAGTDNEHGVVKSIEEKGEEVGDGYGDVQSMHEEEGEHDDAKDAQNLEEEVAQLERSLETKARYR